MTDFIMKKTGEPIIVVGVIPGSKTMLEVFSYVQARKTGCGWMKVKPSHVIPANFVEMSNTAINKACNGKVHLIEATFRCSDGTTFSNFEKDLTVEEVKASAAQHQAEIDDILSEEVAEAEDVF